MPLLETLRCDLNWIHPHRRCEATVDLPALEGSAAGQLLLFARDELQCAQFTYPLIRRWRLFDAAGGADLTAQKNSTLTLALMLDVLIGAPTNQAQLVYVTELGTEYCPGGFKPVRALYDWPPQRCDTIYPSTLSDIVGAAPSSAPGALTLLAEAMHIDNPVARFICVWQSLAFHQGTDSPGDLDRDFFDRLGIARDCPGKWGPESKYAQLRNMLSHPRDRDAASYEAIDSRARDLSDELALLVLRDVIGGGS